MTEAAYQACRKVMQRANFRRGQIATAKGNVAKWTAIEASHRNELREAQADGAKKALDKALIRLEEEKKKFADLKFPDIDLVEAFSRCKDCGMKVEYGVEYCGYSICIKELQ